MEYQKVRINRQKMQFFMWPKLYVIIGPEDIDISHKLHLTAAWLAQLEERRSAGRGFKPRLDQHSGSLNNWQESTAFVMTSANG